MTVVMMIVTGVSTMGAVAFSDDFEDGNRDGWYRTSGGNLSVADDAAGIGSGNALYMDNNSTSTQRRILANFSAVELLAVGDSLSLSFDFRLTAPGNVDGGFRFGLFNSRGTLQTADATSGTSSANAADDIGYFVMLSLGTNTRARLVEERAEGTSFMGGTDLDYHQTIDDFGGISDALKHTAVFTVTRVSSPSVQTPGEFVDVMVLELLIDGELYMIDADGDRASLRSVFDEVGFSGANTASNFIIDNVNVTFTPVPEPATLALLGLGGAAAALKRKRSC
jgi:hypothetical protein